MKKIKEILGLIYGVLFIAVAIFSMLAMAFTPKENFSGITSERTRYGNRIY